MLFIIKIWKENHFLVVFRVENFVDEPFKAKLARNDRLHSTVLGEIKTAAE